MSKYEKRLIATVLASLAASASFVACEKKTTVIHESVSPKEESGVEFKVKTGNDGGIDVEGKIPSK